MLRKARIGDVKTIHRMINSSSGKGEMLPRSLMDIYGNTSGSDGVNMFKTWTIFGDAALMIRTKTPTSHEQIIKITRDNRTIRNMIVLRGVKLANVGPCPTGRMDLNSPMVTYYSIIESSKIMHVLFSEYIIPDYPP